MKTSATVRDWWKRPGIGGIVGAALTVIAVFVLLPAYVVKRSAEAYSIIQLESIRNAVKLYIDDGGTMPSGPEWHVALTRQGYMSPAMLQPPRANRSCVVCVGHVGGLTEASLKERGIDPATQLWLYELPACVDGDELAVMTFDGRVRLEPRAEVVAWIEREMRAAR